MFKRKTNLEALKSSAMDVLGANVMVADDSLHIVHMNGAVAALLRQAEADLRKDLPGFDVAKLIGSNIDVFHKNPQHQRQMLEKLNAAPRSASADMRLIWS
jgi:methyl-accepting chemotaxis protein